MVVVFIRYGWSVVLAVIEGGGWKLVGGDD